jgi:hypothetical protein
VAVSTDIVQRWVQVYSDLRGDVVVVTTSTSTTTGNEVIGYINKRLTYTIIR